VSDAGLKELKELSNLEDLELRDDNIADAGLKELKELKNLKWMPLQRTKVTDAGVEELRKALPKLKNAAEVKVRKKMSGCQERFLVQLGAEKVPEVPETLSSLALPLAGHLI
jgi:hypothetical protein